MLIASSQNVNHIVTFAVVFKVQFFTDAIKTDICIMPDSTDIKSVHSKILVINKI